MPDNLLVDGADLGEAPLGKLHIEASRDVNRRRNADHEIQSEGSADLGFEQARQAEVELPRRDELDGLEDASRCGHVNLEVGLNAAEVDMDCGFDKELVHHLDLDLTGHSGLREREPKVLRRGAVFAGAAGPAEHNRSVAWPVCRC